MKTDKIITDLAEAPARMLDSALQESEQVLHELGDAPAKKMEGYWHALGPGLTTGAADDDPAGVATYSQAGAKFGFQLLWLAPITFPLMAVIQEMCARIGLATGKGLAYNIRVVYSKRALYFVTALLFGANVFNIGADLGAIAKSVQLIFPEVHFAWALAIFTVISLGLQIFVSYSRYAQYLKYLSLVLVLYIITAFTIHGLPWRDIIHHTFNPDFVMSKESLILICAILGTTISPYLFFWQTSSEVEDRELHGKSTPLKRWLVRSSVIRRMRFDVWTGMFFSNLVMYFIIMTCGAVLFPNGISVDTAEAAATALKPLAGDQAYTLFALGIIGTGMLAVPVLAGSVAYAMSEAFGWHGGLRSKLRHAYAFYGIVIIAMGVGMLLNFVGLNPIKALIYSAVLNGLVSPIILFFVVRISSNVQTMGRWHNRFASKWVGYLAITLMIISGIGAIWGLFS